MRELESFRYEVVLVGWKFNYFEVRTMMEGCDL